MTITEDRTELTPFEGDDVLSAGVEIRNAAGGLNEAMKIDAAEWHKDDEVVVALRCSVTKIRFEPIKDTDGWRRVHILDASTAAVIDSDVVEKLLSAQAEKIRRAKEAEKGTQRLPLEEELQAAHDEGDHADGLMAGCPACDEERDVAAAGD